LARAEAENIIVASADNARMRAPVLIFIYPVLFGDVLVDTLKVV
jgi:hypothetical protein